MPCHRSAFATDVPRPASSAMQRTFSHRKGHAGLRRAILVRNAYNHLSVPPLPPPNAPLPVGLTPFILDLGWLPPQAPELTFLAFVRKERPDILEKVLAEEMHRRQMVLAVETLRRKMKKRVLHRRNVQFVVAAR